MGTVAHCRTRPGLGSYDPLEGRGNRIPFPIECLQILLENEKPVCFYTAVGDAQTYSYNLARRFREKSVKPLAKAAKRPALCKGFLVFYTF